MKRRVSPRPSLLWASLLIFLLLGPPPAARAADAATETEAARSAGLEALSRLAQALGEDVVAAKIGSLNYVISTFGNVKNPCNCTIKLMRAILQDYRELKLGGGVVYGLNFRQAIIDCFKPPSTLYSDAILNAQGEALARALLPPGRYQAFRQVLDNLIKACTPSTTAHVPPGGTPVPKGPPDSGDDGKSTGGTATDDHHSSPPKVVPAVCPNCVHLKVRIARENDALAQAESRRQDLAGQLAENAASQARTKQLVADLEARLSDQKGVGASSYDPTTGIRVHSYDQGNGQVKVVTVFPDGRQSVRYRPRTSLAELQKALERARRDVWDLQSDAGQLQQSLNRVKQEIVKRRWIIRDLQQLLSKCVVQHCVAPAHRVGLLPGIDHSVNAGGADDQRQQNRSTSSCLNRISGRVIDATGSPMAHVLVGVAAQRALAMTDGDGQFLLETDRCGDGGNLELLGIDGPGHRLELPLVAGSNLSLGAVVLADQAPSKLEHPSLGQSLDRPELLRELPQQPLSSRTQLGNLETSLIPAR